VILDEPVRGSVPPPWFGALPGIERIRTFINGVLPLPPLFRLLGIRPANVGPGSGTWTMPASAALAGAGTLEISAFVETALTGVATTALAAGAQVVPLTFVINHFRPIRPQSGNLLARGRVVNASRFFVFSEVEIEDPQGRQVAHAAGRSVIQPIAPPPPPPPAELSAIDEPLYATPDPSLRPMADDFRPEVWEEYDGLTVARTFLAGGPARLLLGMRFPEVAEDRIVCTVPASEWFCGFSRQVAPGIIATLAHGSGWAAGIAGTQKGEWPVGLDHYGRFLRRVPPDGRLLTAEVRAQRIGGDFREVSVTVHDADGLVVARGEGVAAYIDASRRQKRSAPEAKRILATLLFTDIVGSTEHAKRLGDAGWRALLDKHRVTVRTEIARCNGVEVDTAGDGFFARFDSPAYALECARAVRDAVRASGIEIRAGIHTGECELQGGKVSGIAVHLAARVQTAAAPGEILVSGTVKDLAVGSPWRFDDRGEHSLKGVPGEWRLYALLV
jgi:uncharacterized protein (TIGR00369 family)